MKLAPVATVSSPRRWVATSLVAGLAVYGVFGSLLTVVSTCPPVIKLLTFTQGWTPVPPIDAPENFQLSRYHEMKALTPAELRAVDVTITSVARDPTYDNNIRMHCIRKTERLCEYLTLLATGKIRRPLDQSKQQYSGEESTITADDLAQGSLSQRCFMCFLEHSADANQFEIGQKVHRFSCGHPVCEDCFTKAGFDRCLSCFSDCTRLSDDEVQEHLKRGQDIALRMVEAGNKERLIPFWLNYGRWYEAAVYGLNRGLIARGGAAMIEAHLLPVSGGVDWVSVFAPMVLQMTGLQPFDGDYLSRVLFF